MLDELSALIEAVADVPELAVWVAMGFLAYKLLLAASIVAACLAGWRALMHAVENHSLQKTAQVKAKEHQEFNLSGFTISGCEESLRHQICRLAGKGTRIDSEYIHSQSVDWLRQAIDAKEQSEEAEKEVSAQ